MGPPQKWPLKMSGFPWGLFHPENQWSGKSPQLVNWVPGGPPGRISLESGYFQKSQGTWQTLRCRSVGLFVFNKDNKGLKLPGYGETPLILKPKIGWWIWSSKIFCGGPLYGYVWYV